MAIVVASREPMKKGHEIVTLSGNIRSLVGQAFKNIGAEERT